MGAFVCDLGIFAHQEEATIAAILQDLARQDAVTDPGFDLRVLVVANGCTDGTVRAARDCIAALPPGVRAKFEVADLAQGGKSRAVEAFVQRLSRPDAEVLIFSDADIRLVRPDVLSRMVGGLQENPDLRVFVSRPVKDVVQFGLSVGPIARIIAAGGDGLADWRKVICGQLFAMRTSVARGIHLPVGLPVEDGFIRAMVLTDLLTQPEDLDRIDGDPDVFHVYESIRTPGELVRHQARIVTGSAVNFAIFSHLRRRAPDLASARALLEEAAGSDDWLKGVLRAELPRAPYGFVPFHFLFWRVARAVNNRSWRPKALVVTLAGFALDALVWGQASLRLMRGRAVGHW